MLAATWATVWIVSCRCTAMQACLLLEPATLALLHKELRQAGLHLCLQPMHPWQEFPAQQGLRHQEGRGLAPSAGLDTGLLTHSLSAHSLSASHP